MSLSQKARTTALGLIEPHLQKIFKPAPLDSFFKLPSPQSGDWLSSHNESPQGVPEFLKDSRNIPDNKKNTIYLLPLGKFIEGESPPLPVLQEYVEIFYGNTLNVTLLSPLDISSENITTRTNPYSKQKQLLVADIFTILKTKIPSDAFCLLGITMVDLYPRPDWNFVFGQASIKNRYGVFSFARYNPAFYGEKVSQKEYENILLRRCCRVCSHEIGHMFGITHCVYYDCLMSGSNHLGESDAMPLHLCPVDLRKLHLTCKFNITERYKKMFEFYKQYEGHFNSEINWINKMLATLGDDKSHC